MNAGNLTRRNFLRLGCFGICCLGNPVTALSYTRASFKDNRLQIEHLDDGIRFRDLYTNDTAMVSYADGKCVITYNDASYLQFDEQQCCGELILNGGAVVCSVPSGFKYMYTAQYGNIMPYIVCIATLVGLGIPSTRAQTIYNAIVSCASGSIGEIYMSIDIYNQGERGFWRLHFYKNSNYTDQVYSTEYGPFYGSRPSS